MKNTNFKSCFVVIVMSMLLTSCGHNIMTYSKGVGVELAWKQDTMVPSLRVGSYENVDLAHKENTQVRYTSNTGLGWDMLGIRTLLSMFSKNGSSNSDVGIGTVLEVKSGPMTTGYVTDVLMNPDVKQEHVEIAKAIYSVESNLGDKETHVGMNGASSNTTPVVTTEKGIFGNSTVTTPTNQYTEDAIEKQVTPTGILDLLKAWGLYIIVGIIVILIVIIFTIWFFAWRAKKNGKIAIEAVKETVDTVKDAIQTTGNVISEIQSGAKEIASKAEQTTKQIEESLPENIKKAIEEINNYSEFN